MRWDASDLDRAPHRPLNLTADFDVHLLEMKQVAALALRAGASAASGNTSFRLVRAPRMRDDTLCFDLLIRFPVHVLTMSQGDVKQGADRMIWFYKYFLYDPDTGIVTRVASGGHRKIRNGLTGYPEYAVELRSDGLHGMEWLSNPLDIEGKQLLIFRRDYHRTVSARATADGVSLRWLQSGDKRYRVPHDEKVGLDAFMHELAALDRPAAEDGRESWVAFARALFEAGERYDGWPGEVPLVHTLVDAVEAHHFDLLISSLDRYGTSQHILLDHISKSARAHKEAILKALPDHPDLARIVLKYGWEREAREGLLDILHRPGWVNEYVLRGVVLLNDPATHDLLFSIFRARPHTTYYHILAAVPQLRPRLDAVILADWERRSRSMLSSDILDEGILKLALLQGNRDAFRLAMQYMNGAESTGYHGDDIVRALRPVMILPHDDNEAIRLLRTESADEYVFDERRRLFRKPDQGGNRP